MKPQQWRLRREPFGFRTPWARIRDAWGLDEATARLAWMRGIDDPSDLAWRLSPTWERTFEPYGLDGMGKAVARVKRAIGNKEKITVYGDYDVDGVTATALLVRVLERMGADVAFFIPNRFNDGYGLHLDCIKGLIETCPPKLMISVDCGVRSVEEVAASRDLGIDWIITDHHIPNTNLPEAVAVLHPSLGTQSNKHLAGVGVAFKLAQALLDAVPVPRGSDAPFLDGLLKLVALGTIADIVPLQQENALLVRRGLAALGGSNSPGLTLLLRAAHCEGQPSASAITFGVAPRINAVGRMGGAGDAVKLFLTRDAQEAQRLMDKIERLNKDRRDCQRTLAKSLPPPGDESFELHVDPTAHKGVIGIVASHRMRDTGRPAGICTVVDGVAHCSLRAQEPYDLAEMLTLARPFLKTGGGHKAAAGVSFNLELLPFVQTIFTKAARAQSSAALPPVVEVDGIGIACIPGGKAIERLEPFGQAWPEPSAIVTGRLNGTPTLIGDSHWKLRLDEIPQTMTWFFAQEKYDAMPKNGQTLSLAVSPQDHIRWGRSWRVEALLEAESCR